MKKRNLLLMFGLCAMLAFTACGTNTGSDDDDDRVEEEEEEEEEGLVGEWKATWDLSELMEESIAGSGMEEYVDLSGLSIDVIVEFTDDEEVTLKVDEDSAKQFVEDMETVMINMIDAMMEDMASQYGVTVDELYEAMGYTREVLIEEMLTEMDAESLLDDLNDAEGSGTYEFDDDVITVTSDDDVEEEWEYELDGDELTLTIEFQDEELELEFERQ